MCDILNVPICINGGTDEYEQNNMQERELFINTMSQELFVCIHDNTPPVGVNCLTSRYTKCIQSSFFNIASETNYQKAKFTVGNLNYDGQSFVPVDNTSSTGTYVFDKPTLLNVRKIQLSKESGYTYGNTLPSTGVQGQLFFLVK